MMRKDRLAVVMPIYNESGAIRNVTLANGRRSYNTLESILRFMPTMTDPKMIR